MFTVEVATVVMLLVTLYSIVNPSQGSFAYNICCVYHSVCNLVVLPILPKLLPKHVVKAQADSCVRLVKRHRLRKWKAIKIVTVSSSQLKEGDVFVCEAGDVIPSDGRDY